MNKLIKIFVFFIFKQKHISLLRIKSNLNANPSLTVCWLSKDESLRINSDNFTVSKLHLKINRFFMNKDEVPLLKEIKWKT